MTLRLAATWVLLVLGFTELPAQSPGQTDPWFRRSAKAGDFRARLPWNTFSIELPKDWQLVTGYGTFLVTVAEERGNQPGAAIMLEHNVLVKPLSAADVNDGLAALEADFARLREQGGQNFEQQVKDVNKQRFILIQYVRPGISGMERVVVYAIPAGKVMYRLICIAPENQIAEKYQAIFAHVASSFKTATAAAN
jgi:hypothetical protein